MASLRHTCLSLTREGHPTQFLLNPQVFFPQNIEENKVWNKLTSLEFKNRKILCAL